MRCDVRVSAGVTGDTAHLTLAFTCMPAGKSSFIFALAGALNHNIAILNLNDCDLTADRLTALLAAVPPKTFVLLGDVDVAFRRPRQDLQRADRVRQPL